ncbi:MAG TPA: FlgD immunoglobulin-like domain containing protein [Candidatus Eisenbacteria bacterium]|jgi:hypothetical protein
MANHRWIRWTCAAALALASPARSQEEFIEVDAVVNVLKGAAATDEQIKNGIAEANKILKQAKVQINHKKTNRDVSDKGDDNGKITEDERKKLIEPGRKELDAVCGKKKGWKLYVAAGYADASLAGQSGHGFSISSSLRGDTDAKFGYSIAHEFCHAFTLGDKHVVDAEHNIKADETGHVSDADNLMDPEEGGGTTLTADQIAEIRKTAARRGTVKKKEGTEGMPQKEPQKAGEGSDHSSGEGGEPHGLAPSSDIRRAGLVALGGEPRVEGMVQLQAVFDSSRVLNCLCRMFIDADGNPGTGQPQVVEGQPVGAEFVAEVQVTADGTGPVHLAGSLLVTGTGMSFPLAALERRTLIDIDDPLPGFAPYATPEFDELAFEMSAGLLGPLATPAPVGVRFLDLPAGTTDEFVFELGDEPPALPALTLDDYGVAPGAPVQATGAGFPPLAPLELRVDDRLLAAPVTDGLGGFTAIFPAPPEPDSFYFVHAGPDTGGPGDFTILHTTGTVAVPGEAARAADRLALRVRGPNPGRGEVRFELSVARAGTVRLEILDAAGSCIRTLSRGRLEAGVRQLPWDGRDRHGTRVPPGVYFARARSGSEEAVGRLVRLE